MTKPADSDQIARIKERSVIFFKVWLSKQPATWQQLSLDDFWLAFAASERQAVIEECCRAVCHHCRAKSEKYITRAKLIEGKWIHEEIGFERERGGFDCYAAAIRSME